MTVLLYSAAIIMFAKSVVVQEYQEMTAKDLVSTTSTSSEDSYENYLDMDDPSLENPTLEEPPSLSFEDGNNVPKNSFIEAGPVLSRPTRNYGMSFKRKSVSDAASASGNSAKYSATFSSNYGTLNPSSYQLPPLPPPPRRVYHPPPPSRSLRGIPTTQVPQPYFDPSSPTNISAQLGMHAFLPCTIRNLNNNSISWIRSRDSHILTVDRYTFIADERFQVWHEEDTETWSLQVKYVQERDAGRYECQISTEPKMSHFVHFHVVIPLVHIPGGPDIYVKSGSTVTLKCIISGALILPEYIFWYQGTERVPAEQTSGGRQVFVEQISDDTTIGTLIITTASPRDQGSYTCVPASLPTASITLHVLNAGEHPGALHHGGGPLSRCPLRLSLLLVCLLVGWLSREVLTSATSSNLLLNLQSR